MENRQQARLNRKERERQRHRREILEAAERVFARNGYHRATMEEIAQEAEFSVGTIYNFFENKGDLYAHVVEYLVGEYMQLFEEKAITTKPPLDAISAVIELSLTFLEQHRGFIRISIEANPESRMDLPGFLPEDALKIHDRYFDAVNGIFDRAVRQGLIPATDPLFLNLCLEGIIHTCVTYWSRHKPVEPLPERIKKVQKAFLAWIQTEPPVSSPPYGG